MQNATYTHYGDPRGMTYGVQMLLVANIAAFIVEYFRIFPLSHYLALSANWWNHFGVWELVTYQFLHQGIRHILFNMLVLFFLGPDVERGVGTRRFFILYFLSGILGGLGWSLLTEYGYCVGASGSVFGVLGAFAAIYPSRLLYIWGVVPVKAWILVSVLVSYEFMATIAASQGLEGKIANAAHLGGGIAGTVYALVIISPNIMRKVRWKMKIRNAQPDFSQREIDRILDKAAKHGMQSLTRQERDTLKRAGKR
jgi:membrane associated rhomboid family serine protease